MSRIIEAVNLDPLDSIGRNMKDTLVTKHLLIKDANRDK